MFHVSSDQLQRSSRLSEQGTFAHLESRDVITSHDDKDGGPAAGALSDGELERKRAATTNHRIRRTRYTAHSQVIYPMHARGDVLYSFTR